MRSIKTGMIFLLFLFATVGEGNDKVKDALTYLSKLVGQKYQLSTTGYQSSMKDTPTNLIVPERRAEYTAKSKEKFPTETLKNLALLQSTYINCLPESGFLSSPHEMNEGQLTSCLGRVREKKLCQL